MLVETRAPSLASKSTGHFSMLVTCLYSRSKTRIKELPFRNLHMMATPPSVPITSLPQELVEEIISYLAYDTRTLLACSIACHSLNIAATPHLHYSLTTYTDPRDEKYRWPTPLEKLHELELLPFVKRLRVRQLHYDLTPESFDSSTLRCFSTLTNLQELQINCLEIDSFMPNIQEYFGHFAPALRKLSLPQPKGSCRQILYLIGLFPNLQDLTLYRPFLLGEEDGVANSTLIPCFNPPLCGRLTFVSHEGEELPREMIKVFGGLRFRHMHLHEVKHARLLLEGCAKTLETLCLHPTDSYGENFYKRRQERAESKFYSKRRRRGLALQPFEEQVS